MDKYDVKRFGLILAIQAEIEGMKSENYTRLVQEHSMAWDESSFYEKASELRDLINKPNEQL